MKNELLEKALHMILQREQYYARNENHKSAAIASAYNSAYYILYYAMTENVESLSQFDYFSEIQK